MIKVSWLQTKSNRDILLLLQKPTKLRTALLFGIALFHVRVTWINVTKGKMKMWLQETHFKILKICCVLIWLTYVCIGKISRSQILVQLQWYWSFRCMNNTHTFHSSYSKKNCELFYTVKPKNCSLHPCFSLVTYGGTGNHTAQNSFILWDHNALVQK